MPVGFLGQNVSISNLAMNIFFNLFMLIKNAKNHIQNLATWNFEKTYMVLITGLPDIIANLLTPSHYSALCLNFTLKKIIK